MTAYGINSKRGGRSRFECCDMTHGCVAKNANNAKRKVWRKRARRVSKEKCREEE